MFVDPDICSDCVATARSFLHDWAFGATDLGDRAVAASVIDRLAQRFGHGDTRKVATLERKLWADSVDR